MSWKGGLYFALHRAVPRGLDRNDRDRSPARSCLPKQRYETWAEAEEHVRGIIDFNIERDRVHKNSRLGAYRCEHCGFWHVGHGRGPEAV